MALHRTRLLSTPADRAPACKGPDCAGDHSGSFPWATTKLSSRTHMSNTFNKKRLGLAVACALALGVLSATAQAQGQDEHSLVTSSNGSPPNKGLRPCGP